MSCDFANGPLTETEFRNLLQLVTTWPAAAQLNTLARLRTGARAARWKHKTKYSDSERGQ